MDTRHAAAAFHSEAGVPAEGVLAGRRRHLGAAFGQLPGTRRLGAAALQLPAARRRRLLGARCAADRRGGHGRSRETVRARRAGSGDRGGRRGRADALAVGLGRPSAGPSGQRTSVDRQRRHRRRAEAGAVGVGPATRWDPGAGRDPRDRGPGRGQGARRARRERAAPRRRASADRRTAGDGHQHGQEIRVPEPHHRGRPGQAVEDGRARTCSCSRFGQARCRAWVSRRRSWPRSGRA